MPHDHIIPEIKNELISMLAEEKFNVLLGTAKINKYFGLIGDEGTTCENSTVLSMVHRKADVHLNVFELFMGYFLYSTLKLKL